MPEASKGRDPGEVQGFICWTCKRKEQGLCLEQPPGWEWRPVIIQARKKGELKTHIREAYLELVCYDCRPTGKVTWENDEGDSVPKERDCGT